MLFLRTGGTEFHKILPGCWTVLRPFLDVMNMQIILLCL